MDGVTKKNYRDTYVTTGDEVSLCVDYDSLPPSQPGMKHRYYLAKNGRKSNCTLP